MEFYQILFYQSPVLPKSCSTKVQSAPKWDSTKYRSTKYRSTKVMFYQSPVYFKMVFYQIPFYQSPSSLWFILKLCCGFVMVKYSLLYILINSDAPNSSYKFRKCLEFVFTLQPIHSNMLIYARVSSMKSI
jgi:hypothetical protein